MAHSLKEKVTAMYWLASWFQQMNSIPVGGQIVVEEIKGIF